MNEVNRFSDFYKTFPAAAKNPASTAKKPETIVEKPWLDTFLNENQKDYNKQNKNNKIGYFKMFATPCIGLPWAAVSSYETVKSIKLIRMIKKPAPGQIQNIASFKKKFLKEFGLLYAGLTALTYGLYRYGIATKDRYLDKEQKKIDEFNKKNKTNIKFHPLFDSSDASLGGMNPMSGTLTVDGTMAVDPVMRRTYLPVTVEHELVHANQYLTIARQDKGMERMNLIIVKRMAKASGALQKYIINEMKKEIDAGISDKYRNAKIYIEDSEINLVDYVNALHTAIHNPDCKEKDIPVIVNRAFYENAKKLPPLTPKEKEKAEEYLKAYENYPLKVSLWPGSDYRKNLLEKEAFAVTPWYYI